MNLQPITMELTSREFFATEPKKLKVEENAGTGRAYFLKGRRIVAVGFLPPKRGPSNAKKDA